MYCKNSGFLVPLACLALAMAGPQGIAAQPIYQNQVSVVSSYLNPGAPKVGQVYKLFVTVRNNSTRAMHASVSIVDWPIGDTILFPNISPYLLSARLSPGASQTFVFHFLCGVPGGTVRYTVSAVPSGL